MIHTMLELSTAHITEKDNERLLNSVDIPCAVQYPYEYGFFIVITGDDEHEGFDAILEQFLDAGYSEAFFNIVKYCMEMNIRVLRLDRDEEVCDYFPAFDW